ncbi:MAG: hypothetical protein ABGF52_11350 [Candidatus Asgardarchaeum sp.]
MKNKTEMADFFNNILLQVQSMDGKIVGKDMNSSKLRLAKDNKGAWVNHLADQCLNKEPMDTPPLELEIEKQDIIDEMAKREIEKVLGK